MSVKLVQRRDRIPLFWQAIGAVEVQPMIDRQNELGLDP
jgi:hypothetical protein